MWPVMLIKKCDIVTLNNHEFFYSLTAVYRIEKTLNSSCRCCKFVSCVHPVVVLNAAFCMTCGLLMLVEDARGDHMEEAYSRTRLITALQVAMSVSFCLPHPVAVSACMIC